jgi:DNA-binding transcriptional ArsR family regulator
MDVFHAIADPNRRKMLELLSSKEQTVNELVTHFDVTVGAVSQHLKVLLESRLVSRRKEGRFRYYRAEHSRLKEVYDWTSQYEMFWMGRMRQLGKYLDET